MRSPHIGRAIVGVVILVVITGCGPLQVDSVWRMVPPAIDGDLSDWPGGLVPLQPAPVAVALANDHDHLYIALTVNDRMLSRRIMMGGFTIWLDPKGGRKQRLGIRFPIGPWQGPGNSQRMEFDVDSGPRWEQFALALEQVEVVGPGKNETRVFPAVGGAVSAMITGGPDGLDYELRIPLRAGPDWPVDLLSNDGQYFGLGLETKTFNRGKRPGGGRSGGMAPPGGGRGRDGRGGFGGRSMGRNNLGGHRPKPLDQWLKVTLAQPPG
ncbi:MAG: hypothetical protein V3W14_07565 [Candidatus Neomarinimicrobiota bacterium]